MTTAHKNIREKIHAKKYKKLIPISGYMQYRFSIEQRN